MVSVIWDGMILGGSGSLNWSRSAAARSPSGPYGNAQTAICVGSNYRYVWASTGVGLYGNAQAVGILKPLILNRIGMHRPCLMSDRMGMLKHWLTSKGWGEGGAVGGFPPVLRQGEGPGTSMQQVCVAKAVPCCLSITENIYQTTAGAIRPCTTASLSASRQDGTLHYSTDITSAHPHPACPPATSPGADLGDDAQLFSAQRLEEQPRKPPTCSQLHRRNQ